MSETVTQAESDIATLVASQASMGESLQNILAKLTPGQALSQADFDALHAVAGVAHNNAVQAQAIAAGTATTTATATASST